MSNRDTHASWILVSIMVLTIAGLVTILGVFVSTTAEGVERTIAIIGVILAFVTPTIASLLALLRADEAKNIVQNVDKKLDSAHLENVERLEHIEAKVNGTHREN